MTTETMKKAMNSPFGVQDQDNKRGTFYPVLYGVAVGSYNTPQDYGVGAPVALEGNFPVDYNNAEVQFNLQSPSSDGTNQLLGITRCIWNRMDNVVHFDLSLSLKGVANNPFTGPFELRVKPLDLVETNDPRSYSLRMLPLPDPTQDSPLFAAEFKNTRIAGAPGVARTRQLPKGGLSGDLAIFRARLLKDGTFALILTSGSDSQPEVMLVEEDIPLTSSSLFTNVIGAGGVGASQGSTLRIMGTYFTSRN